MKKMVALLVVAVVASACFEKSDPKVNEKETPAPNTLDSVTEPGDAAAWTPDKCMVDSDCAEMAVGTCETAYCDKGECVKMAAPVGKQCEAEGLGECQSGQCEPVDGAMACVAVPAANGTPCGEFFVACGGAGGCLDGACDDPCDDGNPCTDGKCTATGCVYTNNTVKCDDGDPCTANDVCADGVCGGEKVCDCTEDADCEHLDDGNPCTGYHECKANGTCAIKAATVVKCPETGFEPCQTNECNPASGKCVETVAEDGVECDDAIECTTGDFCVEGECTGIGDITCEYVCDDGVDEDEDGVMDCDEPECWGVGDCAQPECGDGTCQELAEETCLSCPEDCGECPPECGDGKLTPETGEECDDGALETGDGCDDLCKVEPAPANAGDIVITEIFKNPDAVNDSVGEWFEIYNATDAAIDINAWTLKDAGQDTHRIFVLGGVEVAAGAYFVLGINDDAQVNGGAAVDYVYGAFNLGNKDDEVILMSGETVVDQVAYDEGTFPNAAGKTLSLDPGKTNATDNDDGANWCEGQVAFGAGDFGTPGAANTACPFCGDGECNGDEDCDTCDDCACGEGFACVDGNCAPLTANGESCGADGDCASGFCTDGVCCATACDGLCESCGLAASKGTCTPIAINTDPADECGTCKVCNGAGACKNAVINSDPKAKCTSQPEATCGLNGFCDGEGACAYWPENTVCQALVCNGNTLHLADTCDGLGDCTDSGNESCCPYKCNGAGTGCLDTCTTSADCCANHICNGSNKCVGAP